MWKEYAKRLWRMLLARKKLTLVGILCGLVVFVTMNYSSLSTYGVRIPGRDYGVDLYGNRVGNTQKILRSTYVSKQNGASNSDFKSAGEQDVKVGILICGSVRDKGLPVKQFKDMLLDGVLSFVLSTESILKYRVYVGVGEENEVGQYIESIKDMTNLTHVQLVDSLSCVKIINSIAKQAYDDGVEYLVKIDPGTKLTGGAWTSACVRALMNFNPPGTGLIGATCTNCRTDIFTQYMVHRSHLELFYEFFPHDFDEWWANHWITTVYGQSNRKSIAEWQVTVHWEPDNEPGEADIGTTGNMIFTEMRDRARVEDHLSVWPILPRLVLFSLYGSNSRCMDGALDNVALMPLIYPGWQMWVYHDATVPSDLLQKMNKTRYVRLISVSSQQTGNQMPWRFFVDATNAEVDYFIIRKFDSRLSKRDKVAVEEWIASGKMLHVIRDHPSHSSSPISGGMWGGTNACLPTIIDLFKNQTSISEADLWDMNFLNEQIWEEIQTSAFQHDAFSCDLYDGGHPLPRPREGYEHIGSVYINNKMSDADLEILKKATPPNKCLYVPFKIVIITESCDACLLRLLDSVQNTDYHGKNVHVEIAILDQNNVSNINVIKTAINFQFKHGTESYRFLHNISDINVAWLHAWTPIADDQRAVILTDDLELSPLWFWWMYRAWASYDYQCDVGAISLGEQNLNARSGGRASPNINKPFLYRMTSEHGFSPRATQWQSFTKWAMNEQSQSNSRLSLHVAKQWLEDTKGHWIQSWLEWCWSNRQLYTLYVRPSNGFLVTKWTGQSFNPKLAAEPDAILDNFPLDLERYSWNFVLESKDMIANTNSMRTTVVVWSNDYHISPIANIKSILSPFNVSFIDKSLSGHCRLTNTCAKDLKVINKKNADRPPDHIKKKFVEVYKDDPVFKTVDAVMCFHPSAMCELFMPLKKRLFVIATTRFELDRFDAVSWEKWNDNVRAINSNAGNVVAANNLYDAEYVRYFTGVKPIVLPSVVVMTEKYNPTSEDIIVTSIHSQNQAIIMTMLKKRSDRFKELRKKYNQYTYDQLCENTAILHIPYQLSIMSLFEHYAMGIPIIAPSPELLWDLHDTFNIVTERTWIQAKIGERPFRSTINGMNISIPDPNNDRSRDAFLYWVKFGDFYQFKHIILFNSFDELPSILTKTDWKQVSKNMLEDHSKQVDRMMDTWHCLIFTINWRTCYKE